MTKRSSKIEDGTVIVFRDPFVSAELKNVPCVVVKQTKIQEHLIEMFNAFDKIKDDDTEDRVYVVELPCGKRTFAYEFAIEHVPPEHADRRASARKEYLKKKSTFSDQS